MVWDVAFVGIKVSQVHLLVRIDLRASSGASAGSAVKAERDGPVLGSLRLAEARLGRDPLAGVVQVIFISTFINAKAIEIHETTGKLQKRTFFQGAMACGQCILEREEGEVGGFQEDIPYAR